MYWCTFAHYTHWSSSWWHPDLRQEQQCPPTPVFHTKLTKHDSWIIFVEFYTPTKFCFSFFILNRVQLKLNCWIRFSSWLTCSDVSHLILIILKWRFWNVVCFLFFFSLKGIFFPVCKSWNKDPLTSFMFEDKISHGCLEKCSVFHFRWHLPGIQIRFAYPLGCMSSPVVLLP